jgi:23S rRNA (adenine1618-N6)-methyltransferase
MRELAASGAGDAEMQDSLEEMKVALAFRINVAENTREVVIDWLRGSDRVLWESFCGMVHRSFKKA